jgi:uncharacterized membrane protein
MLYHVCDSSVIIPKATGLFLSLYPTETAMHYSQTASPVVLIFMLFSHSVPENFDKEIYIFSCHIIINLNLFGACHVVLVHGQPTFHLGFCNVM